MQLFFQEDISGERLELNPDESKHLTKVLRKTIGSVVYFTNGRGEVFTCQIEELDLRRTKLRIIDKRSVLQERYHIHLAIAPTKNQDRLEWMVEKITEIGVNEITFLNTENTEKTYLKKDRLEKKIIAACKQSLKAWKPKLNPLTDFSEFIASQEFQNSQKFIAHVDEKNQFHLMEQASKNSSYVVLIGPEGDFSSEEIQQALSNNFSACSLGNSRLRTETAGMVAVHTLSLVNL